MKTNLCEYLEQSRTQQRGSIRRGILLIVFGVIALLVYVYRGFTSGEFDWIMILSILFTETICIWTLVKSIRILNRMDLVIRSMKNTEEK